MSTSSSTGPSVDENFQSMFNNKARRVEALQRQTLSRAQQTQNTRHQPNFHTKPAKEESHVENRRQSNCVPRNSSEDKMPSQTFRQVLHKST